MQPGNETSKYIKQHGIKYTFFCFFCKHSISLFLMWLKALGKDFQLCLVSLGTRGIVLLLICPSEVPALPAPALHTELSPGSPGEEVIPGLTKESAHMFQQSLQFLCLF